MRQLMAMAVVPMVLALSAGTASAFPFTDNFNDNDLVGWTTNFGALAVGGAAVLNDADGYADLFQAIELGAGGHYTFSFDVRNELGPVAENTPSDDLAVSLYFANDPGDIFSNGSMTVMDLNYNNAFLADGVTSLVLGDWTRYTVDFTTDLLYAVPYFELFDYNSNPGDSTARLDNVSLVPEPFSMVMLGCLGAGMFAARKLRRQKKAA